jgi:hypothetical protein
MMSMRLGKEQAAGYIEDTEADALAEQELAVAQPESVSPVTAAEDPELTVS